MQLPVGTRPDGNPSRPASERPRSGSAKGGETLLALQRRAGNRAVGRLLARESVSDRAMARVPRQPIPTQATPLLSPRASAAAITDVNNHYDEDSIRIIQRLAGRAPDGVFDADDAAALARQQQIMHLSPTGTADERFLDALLKIVGPTAGARSALIHLVVDRAGLDVSSVLGVVSDPNADSRPQTLGCREPSSDWLRRRCETVTFGAFSSAS